MRGVEPAGAPQVGADDDGLDVVGPQVRRAGDLGVAEAVEGEARLQHLLAAPGQRVGVGRLGGAQRADAELAVLEHLGVAERDLVARRAAADPQPDPADEVLPEVDERRAGRRRADLDARAASR